MRIFIHLKDGDTIIEDSATSVKLEKGNITLTNGKGYALHGIVKDKVHRVEILPELWKY